MDIGDIDFDAVDSKSEITLNCCQKTTKRKLML